MLKRILYTALFLLSIQGFSQEIKNTDTLKKDLQNYYLPFIQKLINLKLWLLYLNE